VQITQHVLHRLEALDDLARPADRLGDWLEEISEPLGGDAGFVALAVVGGRPNAVEVFAKFVCRIANPRRECVGEWRRR
jgi:hypothetical protein